MAPRTVRAVHYFIQEFDGSISHYIGTRRGDENDFLFKRPSRFKNANEAFVLFNSKDWVKQARKLDVASYQDRQLLGVT